MENRGERTRLGRHSPAHRTRGDRDRTPESPSQASDVPGSIGQSLIRRSSHCFLHPIWRSSWHLAAQNTPDRWRRRTFCDNRGRMGDRRIDMRSRSIVFAALLCVASGCSRSVPPGPELAMTATIKDLMDAMVDPNAEYLFDNIVEIVDEKGIIDKTPKTDDEWAEVRRRAVLLFEAPNLLVTPGRKVAKPGEKPKYPEVELGLEQIQKLIDDDRDAFVRRAKRLQDAAGLALKAIDARDKKELFAKLGDVDKACESCHLRYWYPNDKRAREAAAADGVVD